MLDDYVLTGRGNQLTVTRDGEIVGWLSHVYSDGRAMWGFSPASPNRAHEQPLGPQESAAAMLAAWVEWVEDGERDEA